MIYWLAHSPDPKQFWDSNPLPPGWLSVDESVSFSQFKSDRRKIDWLLGRWTAKHLIQSYLGMGISLQDIEILSNADGSPKINLPSHALDHTPVTLSISHSHGKAICALVPGENIPIGVDIERIEERTLEFVKNYFVDDEIARIDSAAIEMRARVTTAIWSAKEAALKSIRLGLLAETFAVRCIPHGRGKGEWSPVEIRWDEIQLKLEPPSVTGWWRVDGEFAMTIVGPASDLYYPVN
jgi:4'-phosphopantetheinyl transferase